MPDSAHSRLGWLTLRFALAGLIGAPGYAMVYARSGWFVVGAGRNAAESTPERDRIVQLRS